ncbi:MAG: efflux RND transporter permease subunit, partial [Alphaproteobacteria bacterium]
PYSSTIAYTDRYVQKIDTVLNSVTEIERRVTQVTNPTYEMGIQLINARDRSRSTDDIVADLNKQLSEIIGVEVRVSSSSSGLSEEKSIVFVIMGNKNHQELKELSKQITQALYTSGLASGVRAETSISDVEDFTLTVNRNKISSLGIEAETIAENVDALIRGQRAGSFKKDNKLYDVKVEVEDKFRRSPTDITNLFIQSTDRDKTLVPLAELVTVQSRAGPKEVRHTNRVRSISYKIELNPSYSLDTGIAKVKSIGNDILPKDVRVEFIGETKRFLEESSNVQLIFLLALAFIYLVMAAQFESWIDPFIIILTVPLSLAGAILVLRFIDHGSINLYSQIGLVTLIGLITKHGIMMVDFANRLRDQGQTIYDAITQAARLRLRPILMTTFAMVLGTVPLALASGAGSESRRQIGWVIVGGMSVGTIFTLFVLPTVYMLLTRRVRNVLSTDDNLQK